MAHKHVSIEFLIWSATLFLWAFASYGVKSTPLADERAEPRHTRWYIYYAAGVVISSFSSLVICRSAILPISLLVSTALPALVRGHIPPRWVAETESGLIIASCIGLLAITQGLHPPARWRLTDLPIGGEQFSALFILAAGLLVVVRGGTYIVRGFLKKAGTLPRIVAAPGTSPNASGSAAQMAPDAPHIDQEEYNRGRLIGNLERLLLTVVVAAGSFTAIGFLVAAKGLIRFEEFQQRAFTEYFLVGSLASVLIAFCAGLAVRFSLLALWPELLMLQMQSGG
jgi:hypothetical protein